MHVFVNKDGPILTNLSQRKQSELEIAFEVTCTERMKLTGAQILWDALVREGVHTVFGYPGGAILPAYDAMLGYPIRHVLVRHEQGATHMADGFARASGQVGVAIATSGPGATNMVTGIATAMMDSSPIVCITGQVGSKLIGSDAFQETDITGITLPITKHNYLVTRAEDVAPAVMEAFAIARAGRPGPVLVDITKDAQQNACEVDWDAAKPRLHGAVDDALPGDGDFQDAVALINAAERPLILAGHGIMLSGAERQVLELANMAQIPIAMTLLGLGGVPASHPLNLGMMGMHGEAWVNQAVQQADLLIALGMRFDDRVTGNIKTYNPTARKIHVDIDRAELNKNVRVDVAIAKDLRAALGEWLPHVKPADRSAWIRHIDELKGDAAVRDIQSLPDNGHLYAAHVINDIWRLTEGNAIVVTDVGQHQMWEAQYYKHDRSRTLITSGGLGTMGFALPAAIGAKMAKPDAEVWVVVGDGGFQMTMAELATLAQERLDINVCIINNFYLGMVRQWQEFFYDKRYAATPISGPNFGKLAESFGIDAHTVTKRSEVEAAVQAARRSGRAAVIDFQVEQEDTVYPMVPAGADLHKMIRRPSPIVETAAD
jgi:acetolactate synthase-1/2/3 large subunit